MSSLRFSTPGTTTTIELPKTLFTVVVPILATYSEEELRVYGMTTGASGYGINYDPLKQNSKVKINLVRIIDIYSRGYTISAINQAEMTKIYQVVKDYIEKINYMTNTAVNKQYVDREWYNEVIKFLNEIEGNNGLTLSKRTPAISGFDLGRPTIGGEHFNHTQEPSLVNQNNAFLPQYTEPEHYTNVQYARFGSIKDSYKESVADNMTRQAYSQVPELNFNNK